MNDTVISHPGFRGFEATRIARINMVECQVKPNRVYDADLLDAMLDVPREVFLPASMAGVAYVDDTIECEGRVLVEPLIAARLLETAALKATDNVLVVGGCGYIAALAARIARSVIHLVPDDVAVGACNTAFAQLPIANLQNVTGHLADGNHSHGPYDAIVVAGAICHITDAFVQQLTPSGRIAAVVGAPRKGARGTLTERVGNSYSTRPVFDADLPLLPGFGMGERFAFA